MEGFNLPIVPRQATMSVDQDLMDLWGLEQSLYDDVRPGQPLPGGLVESARAGAMRGIEEGTRRAAWPRVAGMLMPQDAGDVALSMAMGPGLGRGMRFALAGLGGMTTQPTEAEANFLPRFMVQRLLGSANPEVRRMGQEGMDALAAAERNPAARQFAGSHMTDQRRNDMFPDVLYGTSEHNVLPTEAGLAWALPPERRMEYWGLLDAGDLANNTGQARRYRRDALVNDPALKAALPPSSLPNANIIAVGPRQGNEYGSYNPLSGLVRVNAGLSADMRDTFSHELQHRIQFDTPGRYARGTNPTQVGTVNSNLWDEYLQSVQNPDVVNGWTTAPAGLTPAQDIRAAGMQMYQRNFGEWEARLAGLHNRYGAGAPLDINSLGYTLDEFLPNNPWPDFRVR